MQWLNLEDNVNLLSLIGAILIILITLVIVGRMFK
ncbi:TPA: cytochrome C oxidase Cbb3, partial [Campylobacter jejuni]|nr:cytochrome C oxidase Cbb3 [Campylobacter jejuni]